MASMDDWINFVIIITNVSWLFMLFFFGSSQSPTPAGPAISPPAPQEYVKSRGYVVGGPSVPEESAIGAEKDHVAKRLTKAFEGSKKTVTAMEKLSKTHRKTRENLEKTIDIWDFMGCTLWLCQNSF